MMKKTMLMLGFLLIVVLLGGWSSMPYDGLLSSNAVGQQAAAAASGDPELVVNNLTEAVFYMTMTGPQTYTVQVVAGKNTFVVVQGEYTLSYYACGAQQTKTVNVKKNGASIKLVCETVKAGKTPKLTIDNKTGPLYITLTGEKNYYFQAPSGKTTMEILPGTYEVSYFACGAQTSYEFEVKKKGGTLKISCLAITFFNLNDSSNVNLELDGPAYYYLTLPPGKTNVQMLPGTYNYELSGPCDGEGTIKIKKKMTLYVYCFP
jgi:hypothetical protein